MTTTFIINLPQFSLPLPLPVSHLDECINAKCLACLKEADIQAVAAKLSIGGRVVFCDICKEVMENVCL